MKTDTLPPTGYPAGEDSATMASTWSAPEPALPPIGDGSHLTPCPSCGVENGSLCTTCWNCEGLLTPTAPLRLVTRDGAEVVPTPPAHEGAPTSTSHSLRTTQSALLNEPGGPVHAAPAAGVPALHAGAEAGSWLPEWTSALNEELPDCVPTVLQEPRKVNLRLIAGACAVVLIAGGLGYYGVHASHPDWGWFGRGATVDAAARAGEATDETAMRSSAAGAGAPASPDALNDAIAAADRALATGAGKAGAAASVDATRARADDALSAGADVSALAPAKHPRRTASAEPSAVARPPVHTPPSRPAAAPPPVSRPCSPTLAALSLCSSASP
jgi:hypothetical protein